MNAMAFLRAASALVAALWTAAAIIVAVSPHSDRLSLGVCMVMALGGWALTTALYRARD